MDTNGTESSSYGGHIGTMPSRPVFGGGIGSSDFGGGNDYATATDSDTVRPVYGGGIGSNMAYGGGIGSNGKVGDVGSRIGTMSGIASPYAQQKKDSTGWTGTFSNLTNYIPTFTGKGAKQTHGLDGSQFPGLISGQEYEADNGNGSYAGINLPGSTIGGSSTIISSHHTAGRKTWANNTQESAPQPKSDTSGEYETKIVNEFVSSSGVRKAAPTRKECSEFAQKCSSLNIIQIAELLNEKLEDHEWVVRLKSLHGIEALLKSGSQPVIDYFTENCDNIFKQSEAVHETIRQQAEKVSKLLNIDDEDDASNYGPTLLDGFEDATSSKTQSTIKKPGSVSFKGPTVDDDFFASMQEGPTSTSSTASDIDDLFGNFNINTNTTTGSSKTVVQKVSTPTQKPSPKTQTIPKSASTSTPSSSSGTLSLDEIFSSPSVATPSTTPTSGTTKTTFVLPITSTVTPIITQPYPHPPPFSLTPPTQYVYPPQYPYMPMQTGFVHVPQGPLVQRTGIVPPINQPPRDISPSRAFDFMTAKEEPEKEDSFDFVKQAYLK